MKLRRYFCSLLGAFAWFGVVSVAKAAPDGPTDATWSVEVSGPCAAVPGFSAAVVAAVPPKVSTAAAHAEMLVRVRTELQGGSRARVEVFDTILDAPAGSREITSDTPGCAALQDQLVLVVGILVEAGRGAPQPAPEPLPEEAPLPPAPRPPPESGGMPPAAPAPAPPPKAHFRPRSVRIGPERYHSLSVVAGAGWGLLPGVYATEELRWSIRAEDRWPLRLAGVVAGPATAKYEDKRARLLAGYVTFGPCPSWGVGRRNTQLGGCGLLGLGATRSKGGGELSRPVQSRGPLILAGAEAFARILLGGQVDLVVGVQALVLLYRSEFYYENALLEQQDLFRAAPVAVAGHLGLNFRFR